MAVLERVVEWEGEFTRLVSLKGLPTRDGGYRARAAKISRIVVHQSAGNFKRGVDAATAIARFHTADPKYNDKGKWIGGGRGWPGIGYTFVVPGEPELVDNKIEVFRTNPDDRHTYHTGTTSNRVGVAVCFGGSFASRHLGDGSLTRPAPARTACVAGQELILSYLLPLYGLEPSKSSLMGHCDVGKPACPGDWLEAWVRHHRGEPVPNPMVAAHAPVQLVTVEDRQRALVRLGYDLGPFGPKHDGVDGSWGEASKGALLAFQASAGLEVDGRWGPVTTAAVMAALAELVNQAQPSRGGFSPVM